MKKEVRFVASAPTPADCPPPGKPEFALIGRSNVGKSSLSSICCAGKKVWRG
jgi:GTP-binding protein